MLHRHRCFEREFSHKPGQQSQFCWSHVWCARLPVEATRTLKISLINARARPPACTGVRRGKRAPARSGALRSGADARSMRARPRSALTRARVNAALTIRSERQRNRSRTRLALARTRAWSTRCDLFVATRVDDVIARALGARAALHRCEPNAAANARSRRLPCRLEPKRSDRGRGCSGQREGRRWQTQSTCR